MPAGASLTWQIVYSHRGATALMLVKGQASAIDAACDIFDAGGELHRVEIGGTLWRCTLRSCGRSGRSETRPGP